MALAVLIFKHSSALSGAALRGVAKDMHAFFLTFLCGFFSSPLQGFVTARTCFSSWIQGPECVVSLSRLPCSAVASLRNV